MKAAFGQHQLFVPDDDWVGQSARDEYLRDEIAGQQGLNESSRTRIPHCKKDLQTQMTLVYSQYSSAVEKSGRSLNKRRISDVNVAELLPPGWTPSTSANVPKKPQPPIWKVSRSKRPPPSKRVVTSTTAALVPPLGQTPQEMGDEQMEEEKLHVLTAADAEERYRAGKEAAMKFMIKFAQSARYACALHKIYKVQLAVQNRACFKIQQWQRATLTAFKRKVFLQNMRWPVRFIVNTRLWRKNVHADRIASFLREYRRLAPCVKIRQAVDKIMKTQRTVRSFVAVCKARIKMISIFWEREEARVRKIVYANERRHAAKLKADALKRLLEREAQRKGHHNIHTLWAKQNQEVSLLLTHLDVVQQNYRKNYESSKRLYGDDAPSSSSSPSSSADTAKNNGMNAPTGEEPVRQTDTIPVLERESIIVRYMKDKRRKHVALLREAKMEKKRIDVTLQQCRNFIVAQDPAELAAATESIAATIFPEHVKKTKTKTKSASASEAQASAGEEEDWDVSTAPAANVFLLFTDARLGPSWRSIVALEVKRDIKENKTVIGVE
jgi:hypothetical protein